MSLYDDASKWYKTCGHSPPPLGTKEAETMINYYLASTYSRINSQKQTTKLPINRKQTISFESAFELVKIKSLNLTKLVDGKKVTLPFDSKYIVKG